MAVEKAEELCQHVSGNPRTVVTGAVSLTQSLNCGAAAASGSQRMQQDMVPSIDFNEPADNSDVKWSTIVRRKPALRVRGVKTFDDTGESVKAVPRKAVVTAFVSRLHKTTTEEDLALYLAAEGMTDIVCHRIKPKNGRRFSTAAFFVSCSAASAELFYNEKCWPAGAELRDWVYKQ